MKIGKLAAMATLVLVFCCVGNVAATTVVVSPGNMDSWTFFTSGPLDNTPTVRVDGAVADFATGPGTPPLGIGSAHLNTGLDGSTSAQMRNSAWAGTKIADLTTLAYSTFATAWNGQQLPLLTIYLDTDGDGFRDDRLWFEPAYSSAGAGNGNPSPQPDVALNSWQTWNCLTGMWYDDNGPSGPGSNAITLSAYLALYPNATITNDTTGTLGGIRILSGCASPSDTFNAYVDAFSIGVAAGTTTYDFEPQTAPVPEPITIFSAFMAMSSLGMYIRKRTRG
jgi:hypothetical protein